MWVKNLQSLTSAGGVGLVLTSYLGHCVRSGTQATSVNHNFHGCVYRQQTLKDTFLFDCQCPQCEYELGLGTEWIHTELELQTIQDNIKEIIQQQLPLQQVLQECDQLKDRIQTVMQDAEIHTHLSGLVSFRVNGLIVEAGFGLLQDCMPRPGNNGRGSIKKRDEIGRGIMRALRNMRAYALDAVSIHDLLHMSIIRSLEFLRTECGLSDVANAPVQGENVLSTLDHKRSLEDVYRYVCMH